MVRSSFLFFPMKFKFSIELKKAHTLLYKPYSRLESGFPPRRIQKLDHIQSLVNASQWHDARRASYHLIQEALTGLHYLQTYDRTLLRIIVSLSYVGWMLYAALYVIRPLEQPAFAAAKDLPRLIKLIPRSTAFASWFAFYLQRSPLSYYIYVSFPVHFWARILSPGIPYFLTPAVKARSLAALKQNIAYVGLALAALFGIAVRFFVFVLRDTSLIDLDEHMYLFKKI